MKNFRYYLWVLLLPLAACSTQKLAQQSQDNDNVYVSKAKAKEGQVFVREQDSANEEEAYSSENTSNTYREDDFDRYDEMSYTSRIHRFGNYSPWRNYFDPWYDDFYDPYLNSNMYFYNRYPWGYQSGWSFNFYMGPSWSWYYPYNPWFFQYPASRFYWDWYSFYRPVPYVGYYGGNYGNYYPVYPGNPVINRPRPVRGTENGQSIGNGSGNRSRPNGYGGSNPTIINGNMERPRPARVQNKEDGEAKQRPSRREETPKSETENKPNRPARNEQVSPPAPSSNNNSRRTEGNRDNRPRPARTGGNR